MSGDFYGRLLKWLVPLSHRGLFPKAPLPPDYAAQAARAEHALQSLSDTFSQEQQALYLTYEEAYNGLIDLEFCHLFRETFRLARKIFR